MKRYCRATSVNDNGHRYFEINDDLILNMRTQHLLGVEDCILDVPVLKITELVVPHLLVSGNSSLLYLDSGRINFLYFEKNGQLLARFNKGEF